MLIPNPQCDGLGDGAFARWLGHEGEVIMNRISTHMKEIPENSLAPFDM